MVRLMRALLLGAVLILGQRPMMAQSVDPAPAGAGLIGAVTLDLDRLFRNSLFGKDLLSDIEAKQLALIEENRVLFQSLENKERALTTRRAAMTPEAFAPLSTDFDQKAEAVRKAQAEKEQALKDLYNSELQRFFDTARPVLGTLMQERGAVAIIDGRSVLLGANNIDITAEAIQRLDVAFPSATPP
jgi:Skp family chaperone for outer membrane proteins